MRTILFSMGILLLIGMVEGKDEDFIMKAEGDGDKVKLKCPGGHVQKKGDADADADADAVAEKKEEITLQYKDESSGEYECKVGTDIKGIYHVKFRTCDNCIEVDWPALVGLILGNIVATILIGASVYSISTQSKGPKFPSNKPSQDSDRRNLLQNDATYQQLTNTGRAAEYDVLHQKRRK